MRIEDVDQAGTVAQWLGVEMFFRMLDSKTTRRLVGRAGFKLVKSSVEERAEDGHNIPYVCSLAEKPADYAAEQSSRYQNAGRTRIGPVSAKNGASPARRPVFA